MTLGDALTSTGRWNQFAPFTGLHLVTVTVCLAVIAVLVLIGRSLPNRLEWRLRLAMAVFAIAESTVISLRVCTGNVVTRTLPPAPDNPAPEPSSCLRRGPSRAPCEKAEKREYSPNSVQEPSGQSGSVDRRAL